MMLRFTSDSKTSRSWRSKIDTGTSPPGPAERNRDRQAVRPLTPCLSPNGARATGYLLRDVMSVIRRPFVFTTSPPGERSAEGRVTARAPAGS